MLNCMKCTHFVVKIVCYSYVLKCVLIFEKNILEVQFFDKDIFTGVQLFLLLKDVFVE